MVLAITAFLIGVVAHLVRSTGESQNHTRDSDRALRLSQDILTDLRRKLLSSAGVFKDDAIGQGFLAALEFDPQHLPLPSSRLPARAIAANFGPEAVAGERTGNTLAMVLPAWTAEFQCVSGKTYAIDVYRIVCYYLSAESQGGPRPGSPNGLTLSRFVSEPIANGGQLDAITDPQDLTEALVQLLGQSPDLRGKVNPRVTLLWSPGESISALREIDNATVDISASPVAPRTAWKLRRQESHSLGDVLEFRGFSIASNFADKRFGVARFGKRSEVGAGFPHGFEIQLSGTKVSLQVLIRICIAGTNRQGIKAHAVSKTIVTMEDM